MVADSIDDDAILALSRSISHITEHLRVQYLFQIGAVEGSRLGFVLIQTVLYFERGIIVARDTYEVGFRCRLDAYNYLGELHTYLVERERLSKEEGYFGYLLKEGLVGSGGGVKAVDFSGLRNLARRLKKLHPSDRLIESRKLVGMWRRD